VPSRPDSWFIQLQQASWPAIISRQIFLLLHKGSWLQLISLGKISDQSLKKMTVVKVRVMSIAQPKAIMRLVPMMMRRRNFLLSPRLGLQGPRQEIAEDAAVEAAGHVGPEVEALGPPLEEIKRALSAPAVKIKTNGEKSTRPRSNWPHLFGLYLSHGTSKTALMRKSFVRSFSDFYCIYHRLDVIRQLHVST